MSTGKDLYESTIDLTLPGPALKHVPVHHTHGVLEHSRGL